MPFSLQREYSDWVPVSAFSGVLSDLYAYSCYSSLLRTCVNRIWWEDLAVAICRYACWVAVYRIA